MGPKSKHISVFNDDGDSCVYPWADEKPDCKTQSAGDWYNRLLSISLGGKKIHGANTSPTCEVLCKASDFDRSEGTIGMIRWDNSTLDVNPIGPDISDRHYTHHAYRGTVTASGNVMAYESGAWEPSMRARARATSLLAAGIHAHGCTREDAVETVSIIASDDIDAEAVDSTLLPASHLKREMTIISKANHRLFTRGSLQSGIIWDDSYLSLNANASSVAFDWGRVTAIARYIAEANIQTCKLFRAIALQIGVPYYIVRNSWAYVAPSDYQLHPSRFANVPKVDISKYKIPSLKGTFTNHEQDILIAITRSLDTISVVPDNDTFRAYQNIYNAARKRLNKMKGITPASYDNIRILPAVEHRVTPHNPDGLLKKALEPLRAVAQAIATRRAHDFNIQRVIEAYEATDQDDPYYLDRLDAVTKAIFDKGTWVLAKSIAEENAGNMKDPIDDLYDNYSDAAGVTTRLSRLKSNMFGRPTHINANVYFPVSTLVQLRADTRAMLDDIDKVEPIKEMNQSKLAGVEAYATSKVIGAIADLAEKHIPAIQDGAGRTFGRWATDLIEIEDPRLNTSLAKFMMTSIALKRLSASLCMTKATGYIDGADPKYSYIYLGLKELSSILNFPMPRLSRQIYADGTQLIYDLKENNPIPFDLIEVCAFVRDILDRAVGDMMVDVTYVPDYEMYNSVFSGLSAPGSPSYDDGTMKEAENLAKLEAMFGEFGKVIEAPPIDGYKDALNTYPSAGLAERYARANGYVSFRAAYDELKFGVMFSNDNLYCIRAQSRMADGPEEGEIVTTAKKRGYESII